MCATISQQLQKVVHDVAVKAHHVLSNANYSVKGKWDAEKYFFFRTSVWNLVEWITVSQKNDKGKIFFWAMTSENFLLVLRLWSELLSILILFQECFGWSLSWAFFFALNLFTAQRSLSNTSPWLMKQRIFIHGTQFCWIKASLFTSRLPKLPLPL